MHEIHALASINIDPMILIIYGVITDPHNNQLPIGLATQLFEHCTNIPEVRVRIAVQAWIFQAFVATA